MDKNIIKIIIFLVTLIVLVAGIVYILIAGVEIGPIKAISIQGINERGNKVEVARDELNKTNGEYATALELFEKSKKAFTTQKNAYEMISDEKIAAVKEATKDEEYLIEYLWITLGNYASRHKLELAIIEPGGTVNQTTNTVTENDATDVSTGTGVAGNANGVNSTTNAAATSSPTSGTQKGDEDKEQTPSVPDITTGLTSDASALTVQVRGSYMNLADFVFEVENDKLLRFRLDNIKMKSAGGEQVIASFNVKDFTVLKYLK